MSTQETTTFKEDQTFDSKSIQIGPNGFSRICREQEVNGANFQSFRIDEFILKITVPKVAEKEKKQTGNVTENVIKVAVNDYRVAGNRSN